MTWSTQDTSWVNKLLETLPIKEEEIYDTGTPAPFPMSEIEVYARKIVLEDYSDDAYLNELAGKIKTALDQLDQFRQTGFSLSTPDSILESLEDLCAMF